MRIGGKIKARGLFPCVDDARAVRQGTTRRGPWVSPGELLANLKSTPTQMVLDPAGVPAGTTLGDFLASVPAMTSQRAYFILRKSGLHGSRVLDSLSGRDRNLIAYLIRRTNPRYGKVMPAVIGPYRSLDLLDPLGRQKVRPPRTFRPRARLEIGFRVHDLVLP